MECRIAVMGAGTMGRTVAELVEKKENITFWGWWNPCGEKRSPTSALPT